MRGGRVASQEACLRGGAGQAEVSALAARPDGAQLAVGYTDGVVRLFDLQTAESTVVFSGHKSAVTALNYDANGMRLVSGSKVGGVSVRTLQNSPPLPVVAIWGPSH